MINNYYFLRQLCKALEARCAGLELATAFSQQKDELVLGFCDTHRELWVQAVLLPNLQLLKFPDSFARSKRNSASLFGEWYGRKVVAVRQFANERAFAFELEGSALLVFKLFGNRSNVVLVEKGAAKALFQHRLQDDWALRPDQLDRMLEQDFAAFQRDGLAKAFPTFGKEAKAWLSLHGFSSKDTEGQWSLVQQLIAHLHQGKFYLSRWEGKPQLLLFEAGEVLEVHTNPLEAANAYSLMLTKGFFLEKERDAVRKNLEKQVQRAENYVLKTSMKLEELQTSSRYEEVANILMANLHQVKEYAPEATLFDFYRDQSITIKLNPKLSAAKNAENYYRKAKNQKIEVRKLKENIARKEAELADWQDQLTKIQEPQNVKELRKLLKEENLEKAGQKEEVFPFKRFSYEGFEIWVGKSAANNDLLTQKHAYKEDLWLHARGMPGSHVVLKYQAGKPFPKQVVEKAASLAAYYSNGKTESLCPVICTPKKFVRKPKGLPPGAVIVDKEEVILVPPAPFSQGET
jgi:predicted ribosome quality control (RQC) complex YloA/Tae2 family protein